MEIPLKLGTSCQRLFLDGNAAGLRVAEAGEHATTKLSILAMCYNVFTKLLSKSTSRI
jgi:hypothetical protein